MRQPRSRTTRWRCRGPRATTRGTRCTPPPARRPCAAPGSGGSPPRSRAGTARRGPAAVTTKPSMSTQNQRARSRSVLISSTYAARTMLGVRSLMASVLRIEGRGRRRGRRARCVAVGVEVEAVLAALAAEAALLDTAERRAQIADVVRVEPHHAGLDAVRDADGRGAGCWSRCRPPARSVVSLASRIASASSSNGVTHTTGPKISSRKIRIVGRDVGEHGRRPGSCPSGGARGGRRRRRAERPRRHRPRRTTAPARSARWRSTRRARWSGSPGSPTRIAAARSAMFVDEVVVDRPLDEHARAGGAALAVEREHAEQCAVEGGLERRRRRTRCTVTSRRAPSTDPSGGRPPHA